MAYYVVPDGLLEIERELPIIMDMVAQTARWVHPDTFKSLPIWCPDTARGRPRYDARWSRILTSQRGIAKKEENVRAAMAFVEALGARRQKPKNWTICHIWGYDDEKFAGRSNVVQDPRFYSCIGNMTWLPTPLKGFTDSVPHVKECLRVCAFNLYGWTCEHEDAISHAERIRAGAVPFGYPDCWPTSTRRILPPGAAPFSDEAKAAVANRKMQIKRRLGDSTLTLYDREAVREVLAFWRVSLDS